MAPSPPAQLQSPETRSRSRTGRPRGRPPHSSRPSTSNSTPGRYIPGGPGGGGRFIKFEGMERALNGTGPTNPALAGLRGRASRGTPEGSRTRTRTPKTYPRRQREQPVATPRFSSAAAAAAAAVSGGDGYKPREERGWEEFHPHLDIDQTIMVYSAEDVDGTASSKPSVSENMDQTATQDILTLANGRLSVNDSDTPAAGSETLLSIVTPMTNGIIDKCLNGLSNGDLITPVESPSTQTTQRRRPGRPRIHPDPSLNPSTPKIVPPPGPNPKEKLTLPKPSFRKHDPFGVYDQKFGAYVDKAMANVGYQESDIFIRPSSTLIRVVEGAIEEDLDLSPNPKTDGDTNMALGSHGLGRVEYDMDEQDDQWLAAHNLARKELDVGPITKEHFEIIITKIEKEWHALEKRIPKPNPKPPQTHRPRSSSAVAVNGEPSGAAGEEQDSKCAICDDGDCENTNAIVFCDGCDLAVHQECYGVPFIPEGQWLCRKCQLIGRGTPTCIFCPNIEGAFKQTNSSRWAHLLCAIWIPEVNLGNTTFMEPVMDVERVPKQRWKLTCYICRQKMGACVQCSNKNCFIAFHVTCARRARLHLKMKGASSGGVANLEPSHLKAYCDKHVPTDWRRDNNVDSVILDAQEFYRRTMRNRLWADSQASALALSNGHVQAALSHVSGVAPTPRLNLVLGSPPATGGASKDAKRKRSQPQIQKPTWRLPSGAPVIPQVVFNSVEGALQRFTIRRRKEFVAEACKFWTLKREARRGAALIKRLQLQMENFSSMEITRRNFAGMGAAGRVRLQRRIDFATKLHEDVTRLKGLCEEVKDREAEKLKSSEMLVQSVDTLYFPIVPLLWPMFDRALMLDSKSVFRAGLHDIRVKLALRAYTSVYSFSADLGAVFSAVVGRSATKEAVDAENPPATEIMDINGSPVKEAILDATKPLGVLADHPALAAVVAASATTAYQKEMKKLAKRIIRAIEPALEDASKKEAQISSQPLGHDLLQLDALFGNGAASSQTNGTTVKDSDSNAMEGIEYSSLPNGTHLPNGTTSPLPSSSAPAKPNGTPSLLANGVALPTTISSHRPDLTTTASSGLGGVPWYMKDFDPEGTLVSEERWSAREVLKGMSEELSSMDEEEVRGLVGGTELVVEKAEVIPEEEAEAEEPVAPKKALATPAVKKRAKRRRW